MHSLTLAIQNLDSLPDGGPLEVTIKGQRGLDIGRDQYLDWTLPDPGRIVSSRHCEVRFRDGAYWLHDISSNGTFVNGSPQRLAGPHRLATKDRIEIGHYIIGVTVEGEAAPQAAPDSAPFAQTGSDLWHSASTAPPIAAAELRQPPPGGARNDMMSWFVDIPEVDAPRPAPAPSWSPTPVPAQAARPAPAAEPAPAPALATDPDYWSIPPMPRAAPPPQQSAPPAPPPTAEAFGGAASPPEAARAALSGETTAPRRPEPAFSPPPPPEPLRPAARPADSSPSAASFSLAARMAQGAGVPEDVFARRSPEELAELAGILMRLTCENLKQMLAARAETKGLVRSTNQTMIQAVENNPLKFSPTVEDALRTMFGPPTASYLDARRAVDESFRDLKNHQMNTYVAMQQALKMVVEDLDPDKIEADTEKEGGLGGLMGSRKAKLWDQFAARWKAKTARHDNGLIDVFSLYFAECYDRLSSKLRS